jgi:tripartite-type tricarboxylate transporter receptor subunit TctC
LTERIDNHAEERSMKSSFVKALVAASGAALATHASDSPAQTYPAKPVRFVIPFAPGGGSDRVIRLVGAEVEKALGQPMVPEYKPGAVGALGTAYAAKLPPDGHAVLFAPAGVITVLPSIDKDLPYDPTRDLAPVTLVYSSEIPISVRAELPINSLKDLVAQAKANPGKLTYGHSGNFGMPHIAMELLKQATGVDILAVPYKSEAPAMTGFLGKETDLSTVTFASLGPHVKEGKIRILAQLGPTRAPQMPDVPTAIEAGFPGIVISSWIGAFVPAGTPAAIIQRLNSAMVAALQLPAVRDGIIALSFTPVGNRPEQFAETIRSESAALKKVVAEQRLANLPR